MGRMRKLALLLALLVAGAVAATAAGASGGPTVLARSDIGNVFDPSSVTVPIGTTVHWHEHDGKHNVVFNKTGQRIGGAGPNHEPSAKPWDAYFTFKTEGVFHYYCSYHSDGHFGMTGVVKAYDPNAPAPKITNLHAKPTSFCTNRSTTCHKRGTKIVFTLDRYAKVTATIKPKSGGTAKTIFKDKQRSKGQSSVKFSGKGLKPGKYVVRLRATGLNGKRSKPATTGVRVVANAS